MIEARPVKPTPSMNLDHSQWCKKVAPWKPKAPCTCGAEKAEQDRVDTHTNAQRYLWLREQVINKSATVRAQALFWMYGSRGEFDAAVDNAMREYPDAGERDKI